MNRFLRLNHKKIYNTCLLKYKEHISFIYSLFFYKFKCYINIFLIFKQNEQLNIKKIILKYFII